MMKSQWSSLSFPLFMILIMFLSSVVPACLCGRPTDQLVSCLTHHNVNNFTIYPNTTSSKRATDQEDSGFYYYKLLNFSMQNLRFAEPSIPKPTAIIVPGTREQLVKSVVCCRESESQVEIRVRCGGHGYEGTSWVATDGAPFVVIDMMNLDSVSVDLESQVAWVEGGATLGQTYHTIAQYSSSTNNNTTTTSRHDPQYGFSAGSCPTVGVGGHIAGGGFGLLSRKYGLAADNVVDALLVDAEGRLLDREGMGEDVFWAIRGGGGGVWGIVYAWKIQLLRVPPTVTAFVVSRAGGHKHHDDLVANLVHKWQFVSPELPDEFYLSAFVGAGLPEVAIQYQQTGGRRRASATFKGFYLGPRSKAISILNRAFPELGIVEADCHEMSWIESVVYFSGLDKGSTVSNLKDRYFTDKKYFKAKSDYVRTPIPLVGIRAALDIFEEEPKGYVILDPYGGVMHEISSESIAFPHRQGNLFTIQYLVEWREDDNAKSSKYIDWIRGFYNAMAPYVSCCPRAAYINYMDLDLGVMEEAAQGGSGGDAVEMARVWGEKYFLHNYDRLVTAKTLIDPHNVFRHQQGIPPFSSGFEAEQALMIDDMR